MIFKQSLILAGRTFNVASLQLVGGYLMMIFLEIHNYYYHVSRIIFEKLELIQKIGLLK